MSEIDAAGDLALVASIGGPLDELRATWDARLRAEKDADWWARHGPYLDAQWAALVELGLF